VRDIVNEIPQIYTPQKMAEDAKALTELEGVSCEVFGKDYLKEQNMNAFHAVLGCTENAIGGKGYKPDDIIR
ncbi:hypothetical protein, partial [Priestia megaterium]|uniref:hypothetical protein n=1 Tax=Priestia megaterium TaxID=1404 RepID=UPI0028403414